MTTVMVDTNTFDIRNLMFSLTSSSRGSRMARNSTFGSANPQLWLPSPTLEQGVRSYASSHSRLDQSYAVTLSTLAIPDYILVRPLTVVIEQDEQGMFFASDEVTTVYGYGDTGAKALADYMVSLVEYYELLEESDSLATVSSLDSLRRYLTKHKV